MVENSADSSRPLPDEGLGAALGIGAGGGTTFFGDTQFSGDAVAGDKIVYLAPEDRTAPAQLPADVHDFTGRRQILDRLNALTSLDGPRTAVLTAIHGMAGVGKTALAVHWAHRMAPAFPDGQLYVDLRGYSDDAAMTPNEALGRFLRALGVPDQRIPEDVDERAALFRSVSSGRRMLVILDNAASPGQVRPLLPGSRSCLTLVTSRSQLSALVAQSAAATLAIDVLSADEAVELITNVVGPDLVAADRAAVDRLAQQCAYLPLALRIAAAHVAMGTYGSVAELTEELAHGDRLAALECDDDPQLAVRAAFELSYRKLGPPLRHAFRRLGLIEGPDFSAQILGTLAGTEVAETRRLIRTLSHAHLIEPKPSGRYRLHDLLGEYARERVQEEEPAVKRRAAVADLIDWYVATAESYGSCLTPHRSRFSGRPGRRGGVEEYAGALAWFEAERPGLMAAGRQAVRLRVGRPVWELADAAYDFLRLRRYYLDNVALQQLALDAARSAREKRAQAFALRHLADIHHELGRYGEASRFARGAVEACRAAGQDVIHELHMLRKLGQIHLAMGQYAKALDCLEGDLRLCREFGDRVGEAATLRALGLVRFSMADYPAALERLERAVEIGRDSGSRCDEGAALHELSYVYWRIGSHPRQALDHARRALKVWRDGADQVGEAGTLDLLTLIMQSRGDHEEAIRYARQALGLREAAGDPQGEAQALDTLSRLNRMLGDYRQAESYATEALALRRQIGDRQGEAESLETLARALSSSRDAQGSFDSELRSLQIRREIGDRTGEARSLHLLARFAARLGRLTDALDHAQEAIVIYRDAGDRWGEGKALHGISRIYRKLGEYAQAVMYAQRSLAVRREIGDRRGAGEALDAISRTYLKMGDLPTALDYAKQALTMETEIGDLLGLGWTLDLLAGIQLALGRPAQALRYAERSLKVREQIRDRYGRCRTLDTLGRIHLAADRPEQALEAALRALEIARDTAGPRELAERLRETARLVERTRDAAAAEPYWQEAAAID